MKNVYFLLCLCTSEVAVTKYRLKVVIISRHVQFHLNCHDII